MYVSPHNSPGLNARETGVGVEGCISYASARLKFAFMMTLGPFTERRSEILGLAERYHTGGVRVFGSVARGQNTEGSDVDLLVKPRKNCSLFDLGGLLDL